MAGWSRQVDDGEVDEAEDREDGPQECRRADLNVSQSQIAERAAISQMHVSWVLAKALALMRQHLTAGA